MEGKDFVSGLKDTALKILQLSSEAVLDIVEKDYEGVYAHVETVIEFYRQIDEARNEEDGLPDEVRKVAFELYNKLAPVVSYLAEAYEEIKEHGWTAKAWCLAHSVASKLPVVAYEVGSLLSKDD